MKPYADQSGKEFSLHCLNREQMQVLKKSIQLTYRQLTYRQLKAADPETKRTRVNLQTLYNAINECI